MPTASAVNIKLTIVLHWYYPLYLNQFSSVPLDESSPKVSLWFCLVLNLSFGVICLTLLFKLGIQSSRSYIMLWSNINSNPCLQNLFYLSVHGDVGWVFSAFSRAFFCNCINYFTWLPDWSLKILKSLFIKLMVWRKTKYGCYRLNLALRYNPSLWCLLH